MKRDALLDRVIERRNEFAAALGLDQFVLEMRQRVQLRCLLGKHQRGGDKDVTQRAVHRCLVWDSLSQLLYVREPARTRRDSTPFSTSAGYSP